MKNKEETALERQQEKEIKKCLAGDTRGLSTVEYLILLVVVAVAGIAVWKNVGTSIQTKATTAQGEIDGLN